jgi:hypothetical protein
MSATTLEATPRPARRRVLRGLPWVTWRQHRFAVGGTLLVLGAVGAFLVVDGLAMHHAFRQLGLTSCGDLFTSACRVQLDLFQQQYQGTVDSLPRFLMLLPGLLGAFVGGPLVARELESGTYRFAWTQGRSRVRWIVAKLVILATVLTALALGFSFLFTWWYGPWLTLAGRMNPSQAYEVSGLVFAARTLFAFMLGALAGTLIRRTVPAMAATMAAWLAAVVPSMIWLRHLIEKPVTLLATAGAERTPIAIELSNANSISLGTNAPQGAWEIARWTQNAAPTSTWGRPPVAPPRPGRRGGCPPRELTPSSPGWESTATGWGSATNRAAGSGTSRASRLRHTCCWRCSAPPRPSGGSAAGRPNFVRPGSAGLGRAEATARPAPTSGIALRPFRCLL